MRILSDIDKVNERPDLFTKDVDKVTIDEPHDPVKPIVPKHLRELYDRNSEELSDDEKNQLSQLLIDYADIFSTGSKDIGRTDWVKHNIDTGNEVPFRQRPLPLAQQEALRK